MPRSELRIRRISGRLLRAILSMTVRSSVSRNFYFSTKFSPNAMVRMNRNIFFFAQCLQLSASHSILLFKFLDVEIKNEKAKQIS